MPGKPENLKVLSPEEARKNGSKGGKASVRARKEKKRLKEYMQLILSMPVVDSDRRESLGKLGIQERDMDNQMLLMAALYNRAVETGDVQAIKEIRSIVGDDAQNEIADGGGVVVLPSVMEDG